MEETGRMRRSARPALNVTLPPKFDATEGVEEEFLTPPIWVAINPPPIFERPEMTRTLSEVSSWQGDDEEPLSPHAIPDEVDDKENSAVEEVPQRPVRLTERRSQTFSNSRPKPPSRPSFKRRISDSIATRTRARLVAQQAYESTVAPPEDKPRPKPRTEEPRGERRPVITASALTISLTLARSSSNPYSPPIDHDKFTAAGLPLASPFHEKKTFFENANTRADEQIKKYFGVSKSSRKEKSERMDTKDM